MYTSRLLIQTWNKSTLFSTFFLHVQPWAQKKTPPPHTQKGKTKPHSRIHNPGYILKHGINKHCTTRTKNQRQKWYSCATHHTLYHNTHTKKTFSHTHTQKPTNQQTKQTKQTCYLNNYSYIPYIKYIIISFFIMIQILYHIILYYQYYIYIITNFFNRKFIFFKKYSKNHIFHLLYIFLWFFC